MNDTCPTCQCTALRIIYKQGSAIPAHWCPQCGSLDEPPTGTLEGWQTPATHNETTLLIHEWLKELRESTGGYAEIEDEDVHELVGIINTLIQTKCEADPDGDYPIEFQLINRRKCRFPHFFAIPYNETYGPSAARDALISNARTAIEALENHLRSEQHRRQLQNETYLTKRQHFVVKGTHLEGTLIGYDTGKDGTEYALIRWPNSTYHGPFDHHCLLPSEIHINTTAEGHRFLKPGEIIILSDQVWSDKDGWTICSDIGKKVPEKGLYRRKKKDIP